mmetsp:Transcript_6694/g.23577  ORF Transcript_6694/g.23577 Transcript_6694/m.23577 type:complete len:405 (-) Transcript_6694:1045-2259(-)
MQSLQTTVARFIVNSLLENKDGREVRSIARWRHGIGGGSLADDVLLDIMDGLIFYLQLQHVDPKARSGRSMEDESFWMEVLRVYLERGWVSDKNLELRWESRREKLNRSVVSSFTRLTSLHLHGISANDEVVHVASSLKFLAHLELVCDKAVPSVGTSGTMSCKRCLQLTHGEVSSSFVSDTSLTCLSSTTSLTHLSLRNTCITDSSLPLLKLLPAIRTVDLSGSHVTDEGLRWLGSTTFSAFKSSQFTNLSLCETLATPTGIDTLDRIQTLQVVTWGSCSNPRERRFERDMETQQDSNKQGSTRTSEGTIKCFFTSKVMNGRQVLSCAIENETMETKRKYKLTCLLRHLGRCEGLRTKREGEMRVKSANTFPHPETKRDVGRVSDMTMLNKKRKFLHHPRFCS